MFESNPEFRAEFEKWRASRPQWAALLKAVRSGVQSRAEGDALLRLGAAAGCDSGDLRTLQEVRRRVLCDEHEARKFPAAKKRLAELDREVERLRTVAEGSTADAHPEALTALQEGITLRDRFWRSEFLSAEMARKYAEEVARPMGVL